MKQQNKSHWYNKKICKYGFFIFFALLIICILLGITVIISCTILNTFKANVNISAKAKYFGSIYSSIAGSFLALIGVAASLIFTNYKTNKANEKADTRFKKAANDATKRFKNNVYIKIIQNNAKKLSDLNKHIQILKTSFIQATTSVTNLNYLSPNPNGLSNAIAILQDPASKNRLTGIKKIIFTDFANDLKNIQKALNTHKTFDDIYGYQLKELFNNLPNTTGFNKQNKILKINLKKLSDIVGKLSNKYKHLMGFDTQKDINNSINYLNKHISLTNNPLAKLSSLSFNFDKNMKDYVKNLK